MSRKQGGKPVRGNRKCDLERKRDERAARRALAKDKRNRLQGEDEGDEFISFTNQLQALGLRLREVPGDGNCLFRALGDQLEGHSRGHLRLRQETVQYMRTHRQDFEPFVEDDVPFVQHLSNLSQPGTFAGNDAIVAFARCHQLRVVIHQLNMPLWEINGSEKPTCRELHIAYRYGDHYDSIRRIGDNSESPAQLRIENLNRPRSQGESCRPEDAQRGRHNMPSLSTSAEEDLILSCFDTHSPQGLDPVLNCPAEWLEEEKECIQTCLSDSSTPAVGAENKAPADSSNSQKAKISNKQRKEQQRLEKKRRQEERHRQKVLQSRAPHDQNLNPAEPVTLIPALNTLSI
ncbi:OTU domain-containing protein 3-like [Scleropages formosus]|uniref:OTU domain-containing protein 3 n=1 Tax=Scleropages formosus TaxID=113540 RepID=A0A0N8JVN8_SCLFO|nr:OTU domain-containing protein 3 [Scleropages formosus]XP_018597375.1 OTU domain-containing protein 3 [Scleropages formosus]XP_018597376.1 OTU domain-containing protein 3 [Scleropages formosus]KPP58657.1 OTU domain-containing protein 3-like [Scleropages formosus]